MDKWSNAGIENTFKLRARIGWQGLKAFEFTDEGPYLVTGTDFYNGRINWDNCYHVTETRYKQDAGIQLYEHDLLITKDGTIGKTAVVKDCPEKVTLNSGVFVVRPTNSKVKSEYLYYILNSHAFNLFMKNILTGSTIKHLNQEHFYKFSFDYPERPAEQEKIIEVLSTVDITIEKTRALIAKYKNIKEGLLQDLMTNGIDENGNIRSPDTHEYKDSPLGMIPEDWECVEIKKVANIYGGSTPNTSDISNWDGNIDWITPNDLSKISSKYILSSERKITKKGLQSATRKLFSEKTLIISCRAPVGYCAIVTCPFSFNQGCKVLVQNESLTVNYMYYYIARQKSNLERASSGTTFLELPKRELERFNIAIPKDKTEQKVITDRLDSMDDKIQSEQLYVSKLDSIKKGLMQDLLTHRVPVDCLL